VISDSEPTAIAVRDPALFTANRFAAISTNAGRDWTHINPSTRFPQSDAGFCCDQFTAYHEAEDVAFWLLQYEFSPGTKQGGQRLVRMLGRDGIRSMLGNAPDYASYYLRPLIFGINDPTGAWLDYPQLGLTTTHLHGVCNVYDGNDKFLTGVVWRILLADLKAGVPVSVQYLLTAQIGGHSWRLTQNPGAKMFFATHKTTSQLRVYNWPAVGLVAWADVNIAEWTQGLGTCTGPDNRDWAGNPMENRIMGAYRTAGEIGFLWHCGPRTGRPNAYVRIVRLDPATPSLIGQYDIYNDTRCVAYPAATCNSRGDVGVVCAWGGATSHVHVSATIFDQYQTWAVGSSSTR
jgi:hypothetical protein